MKTHTFSGIRGQGTFLGDAAKRIFGPFVLNENSDSIEKNINLARILVGLGIFHSYLDILGYSIFLDPQNQTKAISVLALSFLFTIGLFTPLACGLLIYFFSAPLIPYLGTMVLIIFLWGMFFAGVGRRWSIDAYLFNFTSTQRLLKYLYAFSLAPNNENFSKIRFFVLFLFWCICVRAMAFHFDDSYWLNGQTLQLLFTTPYLTDHYLYFQKFSQMFPLTYDVLCKLSLFVQSAWELLLIPLMYFWWGRIFVMVQGMAFFIASILFLVLGYLPYYEICMWIFLFNYSQCLNLKQGRLYYDDRCNLCKKTVTLLKVVDFYDRIEVTGLSQAPSKIKDIFLNDIQIVYQEGEEIYSAFNAYYRICRNIFPFCLLFPLFFAGKVTGLGEKAYNWVALRRIKMFGVCEPYFYTPKTRLPFKAGRWSSGVFGVFLVISILTATTAKESALFGQRDVNVMNKFDLGMGAPGIVLIETEANGQFERTVPFMDLNGGRLSYLRNDLLYFSRSLIWQRQFAHQKSPNDLSQGFIYSFQKLGQAVGVLDACLRRSNGLRYYRADLYVKELKNGPSFNFWGDPNKVRSHSFSVDMDKLNRSEPKCQQTFNLPPGHLYSNTRIGLTDSFYKNGPDKANKD